MCIRDSHSSPATTQTDDLVDDPVIVLLHNGHQVVTMKRLDCLARAGSCYNHRVLRHVKVDFGGSRPANQFSHLHGMKQERRTLRMSLGVNIIDGGY